MENVGGGQASSNALHTDHCATRIEEIFATFTRSVYIVGAVSRLQLPACLRISDKPKINRIIFYQKIVDRLEGIL